MTIEPTHKEMVASIVRTYRDATADQIAAGRRWYPAAGAIATGIADWAGLPADRVAAAIAALSPRNPWAWNVADAAAFADAAAAGRPTRPSATTFNSNADRAWAILNGGADWRTSALKVRSFVANILGDTDAVTVDVWAIRVATDGRIDTVRNDGQYRRVADAYRSAALYLLGADSVVITPRDLQAVTWLVAEQSGIGSRRRGRHGLTLKRGTLPIVATLLALGGAA